MYGSVSGLQTFLGQNADSTDPGMADQLSDRLDALTLDTAVLSNALDRASQTIDGYLGTRYQIPITTSGNAAAAAHLAGMAYQLAAWDLWESQPHIGDIPQRIIDGYEHVMQWLRDVAAGKAIVASAVALTGATVQGSIGESGSDDRTFTADNLGAL